MRLGSDGLAFGVALHLVGDFAVVLTLFAGHLGHQREIMELHRISRLHDPDGPTDGRQLAAGDPLRQLVGMVDAESIPRLAAAVFAFSISGGRGLPTTCIPVEEKPR